MAALRPSTTALLASAQHSDGVEVSARVAAWLNVGLHDLVGFVTPKGRRAAVRVIAICEDQWNTSDSALSSSSADQIGVSENARRNLGLQIGG